MDYTNWDVLTFFPLTNGFISEGGQYLGEPHLGKIPRLSKRSCCPNLIHKGVYHLTVVLVKTRKKSRCLSRGN